MMNKRFAAALATILLLAACGGAPAAPEVQVKHGWVRLPAAAGGAGAGYFEAEANGDGQALAGVSSPGLRIEMHESMTMNHMSAMRPVESASFDGERLAFAPGGKHLMIFGLDPRARPGAKLPLTLRFKSGPAVTIAATLVAAGQPAPSDGD